MRVVFMGTPEFAVPSLKSLVDAGHDVCAVFTQPDKQKNRGMKLLPTPVKEYALSIDIPVYQPDTLRDGQAHEILRDLHPDLIVVAAYGKLLPLDILTLPPFGCINVHSSLLPKYRGAAPINWAILNGETVTGVTIMYMAEGLDTGDIILQASTEIDANENAQQLYDRLAQLGGQLVARAIAEIAENRVLPIRQDDGASCYAPLLTKDLSPIRWEKTNESIHNQVRGLYPWPSATAELDGVRCKILRTALTDQRTGAAPGTAVQADKNGLKIACGGGTVLEVLELQPDGKKRMSAAAFLMGHPIGK